MGSLAGRSLCASSARESSASDAFPAPGVEHDMRPAAVSLIPSSMSSTDGSANRAWSNPPTCSNASRRTAPIPPQNVVARPAADWWTWWWSRFRNTETSPGVRDRRRTSRTTRPRSGRLRRPGGSSRMRRGGSRCPHRRRRGRRRVASRAPALRAAAGRAHLHGPTTTSCSGTCSASRIASVQVASVNGSFVAGTIAVRRPPPDPKPEQTEISYRFCQVAACSVTAYAGTGAIARFHSDRRCAH